MAIDWLSVAKAGGSILSSLGGIAGSMFSNATSERAQARAYNYARSLQQQQYDLNQQSLRESSSNLREGLVSAGYNPMLAVSSATNAPTVSGGTPVNANATDTTGIRDAVQSAVMLQNQTKLTDAQEDEAYSQADKNKAEKAILVKKLPYVSKQAKADYMKTQMESAKLENDIHYQNEYVKYYGQSVANAVKIAQIQAAAQKYGIDTPIEMTRDRDIRYKEWGERHPILRNIDETLTRYFNGVGFNASTVPASSVPVQRVRRY